MKIRILSSAYQDLADGRHFYDQQTQGIGAYYLDSLFSDIDSLTLYAGTHRKVYGFHRMLSKRFPWAIYYRVDGGNALVFRVLDCRQDPKKIRASLRSI